MTTAIIQAGQSWHAKSADIAWQERCITVQKVAGSLVQVYVEHYNRAFITNIQTIVKNYQLVQEAA